ncbi:tetratricopeptide repeat protein [Methanospirillum stamsii]|nr:tetratricopeptide repeat protein [Methanospirillum stamsii]
MSFDEGMRLFRSGDIPGACEQFHQAVEQDENNHKAWNALGICLSKTGEYEDAETCFENALMLDPGNATYEKNREKNDQKRPVGWKIRENEKPAPEPKQTQKREYSGYQRNWLQIPLYIIPMILAIANPVVGFLAVIVCAYYIKRDAESINAGMNPDASLWGKMKGWEWMLLLILFWILLPLYSWKRQQIYEENLGYGSPNYVSQSSELPLGKIVVGTFAVFFIIFILIFAAGMSGSTTSSGSYQSSNSNSISTSKAPVVTPTVNAINIMTAAKMISYEELARYPEKYKGQPVKITGKVSQVISGFGSTDLRMFTKQSEYSEDSWFEDDIYVDYKSPNERILEDDIITVYGYADGIQDYTTVLGAERSIPKIKAVTHTR